MSIAVAGERLTYWYTNEEAGKTLRRYWTTACQTCALKAQCTPGKERRISRWEHEAVLETVQARLDQNPDKMRMRRQTVEHPFGTIKACRVLDKVGNQQSQLTERWNIHEQRYVTADFLFADLESDV